MINVEKIALKDLSNFFYSDVFKSSENKPISKARMISYLNNPRAKDDDIVLVMAFKENILIGYRTILADHFFIKGEKYRFGWLSGSWVHPKHRRKGISTLLFNEVIKEWDCQLMYSNYAVASKLLLDKTNKFQQFYELNGARFYNRFSLADILQNKSDLFFKTKFFWQLTDLIFNFFLEFKYVFIKTNQSSKYYLKKNEKINDDIVSFLNNNEKNIFKRRATEFNWILEYPWVKSTKEAQLDSFNYFFSSFSNEFITEFYTVYNKKKEITAFFLVTIRDKHLKIPYSYYSEKSIEAIANFILDLVNTKRLKSVVIYDNKLANLLTDKLGYIYKKDFVQKFFCTREIRKLLLREKDFSVQSGDGDSIFT